MNNVAVQSLIRTVAREENQAILEEMEKLREERPVVTVGLAASVGQRENQQDASYGEAEGNIGFGVVCDGMGGLEGGEMASQTAVSTMIADYFDENRIRDIDAFFEREAFKLNDQVCDLCGADGRPLHAGTTIVAAYLEGNQLSWLSVGDSRIYLLRGDSITRLNREHTYGAALEARLALGEISTSKYREELEQAEALTSFLGVGKLRLIDQNMERLQLERGDAILLCSDGLYKGLPDDLILGIAQSALPNAQIAAKRLVEGVLEKHISNQDNVSVVLLQYQAN